MDLGTPLVRSRVADGVCVLTLNRPERLNAMSHESYVTMTDLLRRAADDDGVRVVLIRGSGRGFCAGADLKALQEANAEALKASFAEMVDVLGCFPKPVVAEVHGVAVGIGLTLLLHCDVVLVAEDARLRAPFTLLNTTPEAGSTALLSAAVGAQVASDMMLTGRWVSGGEAVAVGLAARATSAEQLPTLAAEVSRDLAALEPLVIQATKRLLRADRQLQLEAAVTREDREGAMVREVLGGPRLN